MAPDLVGASYLGHMADLATPFVHYQVPGDDQFEEDYTELIRRYSRTPSPRSRWKRCTGGCQS